MATTLHNFDNPAQNKLYLQKAKRIAHYSKHRIWTDWRVVLEAAALFLKLEWRDDAISMS